MLILLNLLNLLVLSSAVWVWFDAAGRDFSGDGFANARWKWLAAVLLLWVVSLPLYLHRRSRYPRGGSRVGGGLPAATPVAIGTSVPPPPKRFVA